MLDIPEVWPSIALVARGLEKDMKEFKGHESYYAEDYVGATVEVYKVLYSLRKTSKKKESENARHVYPKALYNHEWSPQDPGLCLQSLAFRF